MPKTKKTDSASKALKEQSLDEETKSVWGSRAAKSER